MMNVCLTLLFLTLQVLPFAGLSHAGGASCDHSWIKHKHACYKKFDRRVTWPEAEAACVSHDSHLASIHSSQENDFIFEFMGRPNSPETGAAYWIGVHDTFEEGNFMNTDGSKVTFKGFGKNNPDNYHNEDYVGSWFIENEHITWNDFQLDHHIFPFICKYYLNTRCSSPVTEEEWREASEKDAQWKAIKQKIPKGWGSRQKVPLELLPYYEGVLEKLKFRQLIVPWPKLTGRRNKEKRF